MQDEGETATTAGVVGADTAESAPPPSPPPPAPTSPAVVAAAAKGRVRVVSRTHSTTLVVAPTSVVDNWVVQCRKHTPRLRVTAYVGPNRAVLLPSSSLANDFDVVVTTYGVVQAEWAAQQKELLAELELTDEEDGGEEDETDEKGESGSSVGGGGGKCIGAAAGTVTSASQQPSKKKSKNSKNQKTKKAKSTSTSKNNTATTPGLDVGSLQSQKV